MRWRRQHWPEREPRPEARTLSDEEKKKLLAGMTKEIASSPVLTGLGLQLRSQRGRFYLERPLGERDSAGVEAWGRVTPLADSADFLLEQEHRKGSWSEIARGSARKLIKTIAGDTKGTFHGLGALDQALRRAGKGLERVPVKREGKPNSSMPGPTTSARPRRPCSTISACRYTSSSSLRNGIRITGSR